MRKKRSGTKLLRRAHTFDIIIKDRDLNVIDIMINGRKFLINDVKPDGCISIVKEFIRILIYIYSGLKTYDFDPEKKLTDEEAVKELNKMINRTKRRNQTFVIGKSNNGYFAAHYRLTKLYTSHFDLCKGELVLNLEKQFTVQTESFYMNSKKR